MDSNQRPQSFQPCALPTELLKLEKTRNIELRELKHFRNLGDIYMGPQREGA